MKRTVCLVLLIMFLSSSFLMQSTHAYENNEHGFSIKAPTGWSIQEEDEGLMVVMFTDTYTGASINVVVEETRSTLSQYVAASKPTLPSTFDNYILVSEGSRLIGALDCYELVSTWTYQGLDLKVKQVVFVEKGKAFIITCTALESQYIDNLVTFENSIVSFRITSQANDFANIGVIVAVVLVVAVIAIAAIFWLRKKKPESTIGTEPASPPPQPEPSVSPQVTPSTPIAETKFCRYCGEGNKTDAVYCEKCGKSIG